MTTISLSTKGKYILCSIKEHERIKYVLFNDIKDFVYKFSLNYNEIHINEKAIRLSNSKYKLIIENYKENSNDLMSSIIRKLQKEYRELKKKKLRKQKIKRLGAISCAVLISGSILVNALSTDKDIKVYENINPINIESVYEETQEPKLSFILEEDIRNFDINFDSRVDSEKYRITKAYYKDMITNISNEYGIDPRIMLAIATQESGVHNPKLRGPAMGLMQIEIGVWDGETISAYNYAKQTNETLEITKEKLKDLEFNIRTSCMILKDCLIKSNYNLPVAIQMYNFGYGNINKVFKYCYGDNISFKETCLECDNSWLEYRENINEGDNKYLEHILSYIEDLEDIEIKSGNEIIKYSFNNKIKTLS